LNKNTNFSRQTFVGNVLLMQFSPDGRQLIWGNSEGSVSSCDLDEVQRRLAEVDLGW